MNVEEIRERDAPALAAWYRGDTDRHPQGAISSRHILPAILTTNCRDTSQQGYAFSEWGNLAGFE